jgi:WD40 repeat protein
MKITDPNPLIAQHGQPVEACLITPSGTMALTAGGNEIKVWDILCGGKLLHTFSSHLKNITGMTFDGTGSRLLSCGLDGHVKVKSSHMSSNIPPSCILCFCVLHDILFWVNDRLLLI